MEDLDKTKQFDEDMNIGPQDKIELRSTAKGDITATVRIGGSITDKESLDKIIDLQEMAWKKLKDKFPNLKIAEND